MAGRSRWVESAEGPYKAEQYDDHPPNEPVYILDAIFNPLAASQFGFDTPSVHTEATHICRRMTGESIWLLHQSPGFRGPNQRCATSCTASREWASARARANLKFTIEALETLVAPQAKYTQRVPGKIEKLVFACTVSPLHRSPIEHEQANCELTTARPLTGIEQHDTLRWCVGTAHRCCCMRCLRCFYTRGSAAAGV